MLASREFKTVLTSPPPPPRILRQLSMLHQNVARYALAFLALILMYAASCSQDADPDQGRKHFATGANRERGVEVLNPPNPDLPFYYSFGTIPFGKLFSHTYELRNLENTAITIKRTEPACSCSRVKSIRAWKGSSKDDGTVEGDVTSRDDILRVEPGQVFSIEILVDTLRVHPNAAKLAVVRVYTDSKIDPYLTFELHFMPQKLFELASPTLKLGDIPQGGGIGGTLQIFSRRAMNKADLIDVLSTTEGLQAEVELIQGQESNWNLHVTTIGQEKQGPLRGKVILRTTDSMGQGNKGRLEIPIEGRVVPAIMIYPSNLSFGRVELGKDMSLHAGVQGLAPGHKIDITAAHLEGPSAPYLEVELERIAEDSFGRCVRIDVHVHCKADAPAGVIEAQLTLDLRGEAQPAIIRAIHGLVE
ncbi:MAG: hypothetical protein ACI89E_001741 [Planctomycetota bacterium]|jgi:hypothetical protein